jgi:hypothetical protein
LLIINVEQIQYYPKLPENYSDRLQSY